MSAHIQKPGFAGAILGKFVAASTPDQIPDPVWHEGKRSVLNFFACALGVARDPAVDVAVQVMQPFSGPDTVTLIGRPERLDPMGAAFVNAIAANLLDYDDTHLNTVIHPTAPVAPAVLALAEQRRLPARQALHALILGIEVECRIGNAVSPGHYARGWHITATCGVFGAAAACAKLLGLNADQTSAALGIAASQSAGLVENLASAAKNVGVGNAPRNGLLAALLAQRGYSAAPAAIEGALGWAQAMGDTPNLACISADLGRHWESARNTYKPYPAGIVFHSVIDACLDMHEAEKLRVEDIETVTVSGSALLLARGDRPVNTERDARVSIHHCAAIALLRGRAGVPEFSPDAVDDPLVRALRQKVHAKLERDMDDGACRVTILTRSGQTLTRTVAHAHGSLEHPLSDQELEQKFRDNDTSEAAPARIAAVWSMDQAEDVQALMRHMAA